ncbi:hypothetical protein [Duganella sp.]|uniref:hypothetical protein n=1 Tax=Duganella sp. TaxID=1904440 RepID=UPI002ED1B985
MTTVLTVNAAAQEQAAMHRTELLLARCRNCPPPRIPMAGPQSRWHEQRQAHFLAWLDAGGFAFTEDRPDQEHAASDPAAPRPIENSGIAPLFSVP